jgi:hypothetical protein
VSEQAALPGLDVAPVPKLTPRQNVALAFIRAAAEPVQGDELGAALHERRRAEGGRGHDASARCRFCGDEGRDMAAALMRKSLIARASGGGLVEVYADGTTAADPDRYDPRSAEIPF